MREQTPLPGPASTPTWWERLPRKSRSLTAGALMGSFVALVVAWAFIYARSHARGKGIDTGEVCDFVSFYHAAKAVLQGTDMYASGVRGYIYPPLFAVLLTPLAKLSIYRAAVVWIVLVGAMLIGAAWLIAKELCERFRVPSSTATIAAICGAGSLALADKARAVLQSAQTDSLTMLLIALAFRLERTRPAWCGLCLGLATHIKYHTIVFLPYFVVRRRLRETAGMCAGLALGALAGVPIWGWETNTQYLRRSVGGLAEMSTTTADYGKDVGMHPLAWIKSISITSGVARVVDHHTHPLAFVAIVGAAALASLALGWWLLRRAGVPLLVGRGGPMERTGERSMVVALEWAGLIAATVVFSPQSMGRHFYLFTFVTMIGALIAFFAHSRAVRWVTIAGWLILAGGLTLPPGMDSMERALQAWRWTAGSGWCALICYFCVLWAGLAWVRRDTQPAASDPARAS